jgi:hypothetical protein
MLLSEQPPQLRVRFGDNGFTLNLPLAHQMQLMAGERILFASGESGSSIPLLLVAKASDEDPDGLRLGKDGGGKNLTFNSKALVLSLLKTYGLARTQCRGLVFTQVADKPTVHDGGVVYFNLGKPVQQKGGKPS